MHTWYDTLEGLLIGLSVYAAARSHETAAFIPAVVNAVGSLLGWGVVIANDGDPEKAPTSFLVGLVTVLIAVILLVISLFTKGAPW